MPLEVGGDGIVSCASRVVTTVVAANAARKGGAIQNLHDGIVLRIRLDADPTVSVGFQLQSKGFFQFGSGVPGIGNSTDFYLGDVRVFNPGIEAVYVVFVEVETV